MIQLWPCKAKKRIEIDSSRKKTNGILNVFGLVFMILYLQQDLYNGYKKKTEEKQLLDL